MRSAPPLQFSVNRHGPWQGVVLLLTASAMAAMFAWWRALPAPVAAWVSVSAAAGALLAMACAGSLWQMPATGLRWDGQRWRVARDGLAERAGELAVALDLGGPMLLRFVPEGTPAGLARRCPALWIAPQRRGLEAHWHPIRCALYAARPAAPPGGQAAHAPDSPA
jgi:hypothetical protein